jgi:hypothetical protein
VTAAEDPYFTVSFATGARYDIDAIRKRQQAFMLDGEHAWVVHAVFAVEDPELALDDMELGADNFVGVSADIYCLLCLTKYRTKIRHYKCPQQAPA